jgi:hypothetical protein
LQALQQLGSHVGSYQKKREEGKRERKKTKREEKENTHEISNKHKSKLTDGGD